MNHTITPTASAMTSQPLMSLLPSRRKKVPVVMLLSLFLEKLKF
jgi:hypothetical protein